MNPSADGASSSKEESNDLEDEAGEPDIATQREAAVLAFKVARKTVKITVISSWQAGALDKLIGLLSQQFSDLVELMAWDPGVEPLP